MQIKGTEMMKTDEREVLTREKIENRLLAAIKFSIGINSAVSVLFVGAVALLGYGITQVSLPYQIGCVVAIAFLTFLFIYFWYNLIKSLIFYRRRKYTIAEDRVLRIVEDEVRYLSMKEALLRGRRFRRVEENAIYFRDAGRVVVTGETCRCTFATDHFYIVKYEGQEDVQMIYNQREYRLEDENLLN